MGGRIAPDYAAVLVNLWKWETTALGPVLAAGMSTEGGLSLSDFMVGLMASYKESVRIGVGGGVSAVPSGLSASAEIGEPLPEGKSLDELIETRDRVAFYLMVALPQLTLKNPFK